MPATADLIDIAPETPSCEIQFRTFGKRRRFHGKIRTVRCLHDNSLVRKLFGSPSEGEVLVIDGHGSLFCALLGDRMAELGRENGWAGVIVYGAIRDSVAIDEMDFGVKALGTNPRKSAKEGKGEIGVPLAFGKVVFREGDWVYCDEDGVLVSGKPLHEQ